MPGHAVASGRRARRKESDRGKLDGPHNPPGSTSPSLGLFLSSSPSSHSHREKVVAIARATRGERRHSAEPACLRALPPSAFPYHRRSRAVKDRIE
jgi:hypothetical protein